MRTVLRQMLLSPARMARRPSCPSLISLKACGLLHQLQGNIHELSPVSVHEKPTSFLYSAKFVIFYLQVILDDMFSFFKCGYQVFCFSLGVLPSTVTPAPFGFGVKDLNTLSETLSVPRWSHPHRYPRRSTL